MRVLMHFEWKEGEAFSWLLKKVVKGNCYGEKKWTRFLKDKYIPLALISGKDEISGLSSELPASSERCLPAQLAAFGQLPAY